MTTEPRISIIIPVYNEEDTITTCLRQFEPPPDTLEIIVSDGGSGDRTVEAARRFSAVRVIRSPKRGRATQMNAGAAEADGDIFLFLHADTLLPAGWRSLVVKSICEDGMAGGRFRLSISAPGFAYRCVAWGTNFRSRVLGITYGDQAIYVRRDVFERVGGYPAIPIFEDSEFCDLIRREGRFGWNDAPVVTSARRWQRRGVIRTVLLTWTLRLLYLLAVPPEVLARYYGSVR